jgi:two-component system, chemotaxis family, CheB/CheR fusion protein
MKKTAVNSIKKKSNDKPFPIVAIGASAGGLEAATELFKYIPTNTGMAYIYIQHLARDYKSKLVEIISKATKLPVEQAKNNTRIKPDKLYIIPPNHDMLLLDGSLKLNARKPKPTLDMPIDTFFISLAERQQIGSIGVLLSGSAHDGTAGLKAIKIAGGLTFAQDDSALFKSMPKSAIAEGFVDMVLSPKKIADELVRISGKKEVIVEVMQEAITGTDVTNQDLNAIIQLLKKSTGVDFKYYKVNTIKRRIIRRMLLYKLETLNEYYTYLKQHTSEINVLYQDLLINVTAFFRDPDALEYLRKTILPEIIKSKHSNEPVRVWIPACSTGEEAYSLAIILVELFSDKATNLPVQIFATDLSEVAIAKARLGLYSKNDLVGVHPKRLQRFFTKIDGSYRIVKSIRDLCVFAPHNIFKDPPFSKIDLISCCNLLIYLDVVLQKKIIATFHYALNKNGYLVLGKSETIGTPGHLFSQLERKFKVYVRKSDGADRAKFEMMYQVPDLIRARGTKDTHGVDSPMRESNLEETVDNILLERYVPASVVVNHDLEILQFKGSTGLFLEPSPGKASLNLLKMARPGLSFELRNIIHKATKSGKPESKSGIEIKANGNSFHAAIEAEPILTVGGNKIFLVIFRRLENNLATDLKPTVSKDEIVKQLQDELNSLKDDMRSILEEQEASVEELQSANEEVVSSNEELQSINEELETSKEEVESTNEELMTINNELQLRNEQLAESYGYSQEIFDTIQEAVIVLDKDFRVRSANKTFYRIFKLKEEKTEGLIIFELGDRAWDIQPLRKFLYEVITNHSSYYGFEVEHHFPHIGEKTLLLNARRVTQTAHRKQLILLAIEDITVHRRAQRMLEEREMWFRNMADNAPVMIWLAGLDKRRNFLNKTWLEFTGYQQPSANGETWKEAIHPNDRQTYESIYDSSFKQRETFQVEYRLRRHDGEYRWVLDIAKPSFSPEKVFLGYIGSSTELHNKKLQQEELEQSVAQRTRDLEEINKELQRSNSELQQFAYVASHDLQEPLRKIMTFLDRLERDKKSLSDQGKSYLDKINESSKRMTRLIDDLLDYSRISRATGKYVKTDLNKILEDVMQDFDLTINQKKANIKIGKLPTLFAIPLQMEQLFHNLLSNAVKFTRENIPPEITIACRMLKPEEVRKRPALSKENTYAQITIKDNGIGFPPEFADQIFIIFQRLNDKKLYPGTGIGLALCSRIVSNHGGEIYATGKENIGAEFYIILPLKKNKMEEET